MKHLFSICIVIFFLSSCEKNYVCVCTSTQSNQDSIIDHVKTTKLGSKGYKKTCADNECAALSDCHVR